MSFWGAIKNAASDFVNDPLSVAVPMYGITKGLVKMADGSYANPGQPAQPQGGQSQPWDGTGGAFDSLFNDIRGAAKSGMNVPFKGQPQKKGFWGSMMPPGQAAAAPGPVAPQGTWGYEAGKGPQWSGPKTGNRI